MLGLIPSLVHLNIIFIVGEQETYLTDDKRIKYHCVLHLVGVLRWLIVQVKDTFTGEVQDKEDTDLVCGLRRKG